MQCQNNIIMHKKEQSETNVLEKSIKLKIVKRRKCLLLVFTNHFHLQLSRMFIDNINS